MCSTHRDKEVALQTQQENSEPTATSRYDHFSVFPRRDGKRGESSGSEEQQAAVLVANPQGRR